MTLVPNLEVVLVAVMMVMQSQVSWLLLRVLLSLLVAATASYCRYKQPCWLLMLIICLRCLWFCCTVHLLHQHTVRYRQFWMTCHITQATLPAVYAPALCSHRLCLREMLLVGGDAADKASKVIQTLQ